MKNLLMIYFRQSKNLGGMIQFPSRLEVPAAAFFSIASGMICHYLTEKKTILRRIIFGIIIIYQIGFVFMCIKSCEDALIEVELYRGLDSVYIDENFKYDICDGMYLPEGANVQSKLISHGRHEEKKINIRLIIASVILNMQRMDLK